MTQTFWRFIYSLMAVWVVLNLEIWSLGFVWDMVFGVWNFHDFYYSYFRSNTPLHYALCAMRYF